LIDQRRKFGGKRFARPALPSSHRDKDEREKKTDQASHQLSLHMVIPLVIVCTLIGTHLWRQYSIKTRFRENKGC
jgi:hypothetical protein